MRLLKLWVISSIIFTSCLDTSPPKRRTSLVSSLESIDTVGADAYGVVGLKGNEFPGLRFSKKQMQLLDSKSLNYERQYVQHPDSLDLLMSYARSLDNKGAYTSAKNLYTIGARKFPHAPQLFQYKGLNKIITRDFKSAIKDLQTAAFYYRDKQPSKDKYLSKGFMESSDQFYTWYYLGMAYYFNRNYDSAISSFKKCLQQAKDDDDLTVIPFFWLYIIYQEIGNPQSAQLLLADINTNMLIVKSKDYYRGLLLFKGIFKADRLTRFTIKNNKIIQPIQAYALVKWYRFNGLFNDAENLSDILLQSNAWNNLGYIACEVEDFTNDSLLRSIN